MDAAYTGSRIAALRKEKGWTQRDLASLLHVTDKAVSKWERGLNFPELSLLTPLSTALGTTVSDLLGLAILFYILFLEYDPETVVTVEKLMTAMAVLAFILFAVEFNVLRIFANPVAVFWMGAIRGSRPETMFAFFVKDPPNFADTPEGRPPQVPPADNEPKTP